MLSIAQIFKQFLCERFCCLHDVFVCVITGRYSLLLARLFSYSYVLSCAALFLLSLQVVCSITKQYMLVFCNLQAGNN